MTPDAVCLTVVAAVNLVSIGFALFVLNLKPVKESKQYGGIRMLFAVCCIGLMLVSTLSYFFAWKPAYEAVFTKPIDTTTPEK